MYKKTKKKNKNRINNLYRLSIYNEILSNPTTSDYIR